VVLDVALPDGSGLELCRELRRASCAPVLFVTARGLLTDKARAFAAGGDDYLTKPFAMEELRLRVDALLRRATRSPSPHRRRARAGGGLGGRPAGPGGPPCRGAGPPLADGGGAAGGVGLHARPALARRPAGPPPRRRRRDAPRRVRDDPAEGEPPAPQA